MCSHAGLVPMMLWSSSLLVQSKPNRTTSTWHQGVVMTRSLSMDTVYTPRYDEGNWIDRIWSNRPVIKCKVGR